MIGFGIKPLISPKTVGKIIALLMTVSYYIHQSVELRSTFDLRQNQ